MNYSKQYISEFVTKTGFIGSNVEKEASGFWKDRSH